MGTLASTPTKSDLNNKEDATSSLVVSWYGAMEEMRVCHWQTKTSYLSSVAIEPSWIDIYSITHPHVHPPIPLSSTPISSSVRASIRDDMKNRTIACVKPNRVATMLFVSCADDFIAYIIDEPSEKFFTTPICEVWYIPPLSSLSPSSTRQGAAVSPQLIYRWSLRDDLPTAYNDYLYPSKLILRHATYDIPYTILMIRSKKDTPMDGLGPSLLSFWQLCIPSHPSLLLCYQNKAKLPPSQPPLLTYHELKGDYHYYLNDITFTSYLTPSKDGSRNSSGQMSMLVVPLIENTEEHRFESVQIFRLNPRHNNPHSTQSSGVNVTSLPTTSMSTIPTVTEGKNNQNRDEVPFLRMLHTIQCNSPRTPSAPESSASISLVGGSWMRYTLKISISSDITTNIHNDEDPKPDDHFTYDTTHLYDITTRQLVCQLPMMAGPPHGFMNMIILESRWLVVLPYKSTRVRIFDLHHSSMHTHIPPSTTQPHSSTSVPIDEPTATYMAQPKQYRVNLPWIGRDLSPANFDFPYHDNDYETLQFFVTPDAHHLSPIMYTIPIHALMDSAPSSSSSFITLIPSEQYLWLPATTSTKTIATIDRAPYSRTMIANRSGTPSLYLHTVRPSGRSIDCWGQLWLFSSSYPPLSSSLTSPTPLQLATMQFPRDVGHDPDRWNIMLPSYHTLATFFHEIIKCLSPSQTATTAGASTNGIDSTLSPNVWPMDLSVIIWKYLSPTRI
jgi:hypothetical protein